MAGTGEQGAHPERMGLTGAHRQSASGRPFLLLAQRDQTGPCLSAPTPGHTEWVISNGSIYCGMAQEQLFTGRRQQLRRSGRRGWCRRDPGQQGPRRACARCQPRGLRCPARPDQARRARRLAAGPVAPARQPVPPGPCWRTRAGGPVPVDLRWRICARGFVPARRGGTGVPSAPASRRSPPGSALFLAYGPDAASVSSNQVTALVASRQ